MIVGVIPARGGSKRIPRKNVREFCGKPMIAWAIAAAKESRLFDRVVVSTDDEEIIAVSESHGAEVPFVRPPELADDHASTLDVMSHAVASLGGMEGGISTVCCIYATAPLLDAGDLRRGLEKFREGDWQYVFAATTFGYPVHRSFIHSPAGGVEMLFSEHFGTRTQDLPEVLHDAAQFYWGRPHAWIEKKRVFESWSSFIVLPRWRVQDIDTEEDWMIAEQLFRLYQRDSARL